MPSTDKSRKNNFDFLRISAAFLVLISHQYALSGLQEPGFNVSLGSLGVMIFFSISGFLVSQSWRQDPHVFRFLLKRFLRIWPALAVVTFISAVVLGPILSTLSWRSYFLHPDFLEFFNNLKLLVIRYYLPGVFEGNIYPRAVNGSLWTIPLEVRCYLYLLLLACIGITRKPVLFFLGTLLYGIYFFVVAQKSSDYQSYYGLFFLSGVCLDLFRKQWEAKVFTLLGTALISSAVFYFSDASRVAFLCLIPAFSIVFGSRSITGFNNFGKFGDMSYGLYIYAFPVQQTVLSLVDKNHSFWLALFAAACITMLCAFISWHLVERPALNLKSRLNRKKEVLPARALS